MTEKAFEKNCPDQTPQPDTFVCCIPCFSTRAIELKHFILANHCFILHWGSLGDQTRLVRRSKSKCLTMGFVDWTTDNLVIYTVTCSTIATLLGSKIFCKTYILCIDMNS